MRNLRGSLLGAAAVASLVYGGSAFAAVGGGATIHNAASLTFSGGQVTSSVDVGVETIGTQPTIVLDAGQTLDFNAGQAVSVDYLITSNSNGSDNYNLNASTTDTGVSAPGAVTITTPVTLGASIVLSSGVGGLINIPAGSEVDFDIGDTVSLTVLGGTHLYTVDAVSVGAIATTAGNTTTLETNSVLTLSPLAGSGAPIIDGGNVVPGAQIGEQQTITVSFTAGTPTTPGTDGTHSISIGGNTTALNTSDVTEVISFTDPTPSVTVLSGDATLEKAVRNVTDGVATFATTGVSARTGDVLEYRLTVGTIAGENVTGASLTDEVPVYTTYVPSSTTMNGNPVADVGGTTALESGLTVQGATSANPGDVDDGDTAVILFQVTVD